MADSKINDGGLAFPGRRYEQVGTVADHGFSDDDSPTYGDVNHPGLSMRDWFAGQALAGFAANNAVFAANDQNGWELVNSSARGLADQAYWLADSMIAARKAGAA